MNMTLDEIAIECGTDKSSTGHDYCRIYDSLFSERRNAFQFILELGFGGHTDPMSGGESCKMWNHYAPKWEIHAVELYNKEIESPAFLHFGEQDDPILMAHIFHEWGNPDIVIDDASHISSKTIGSFKVIFPYLRPGGYYCIEDIHSSYHDHYYGLEESNCNPEEGDATETAMSFFKRLADEVQKDFFPERYHLGYDIDYITFYSDLIIIKKK